MFINKIVLVCIVGLFGFQFAFGIYGGDEKKDKFTEKRGLVYVFGGDVNCSGTLIHIRWVITSAHCFFYRARRTLPTIYVIVAANWFRGMRDEHYREQRAMQIRRVKTLYQEVQNVPGGRGREAALLELRQIIRDRHSIPGVQDWAVIPVVRGPFPPVDLEELNCYESGFGFDGYPSWASARMIRTWVKHSRLCRMITTAPLYKEICIQYPRGQGPCFGDWGSPLTCETKEYPDGVLVAFSMRSVHRDGNLARPYHCARGDIANVYTFTGAIYRWLRYYIHDLQTPAYLWVLSGDAGPPPGTKK